MNEQEKLEAYIQQIMQINAEKEQKQTEIDREMIARELGFTDEELAALEQERQKLIKLGEGYVAHQQADDAIEVLEKAYSLQPNDALTLQYLAQAYGIKYIKTRKIAYQQKSETYAAQCLAINPDNTIAYQIIQTIRRQPKKQVRWTRVIGGVVGIVLLLIIGGMFFFTSNSRPSEIPVNEQTPVQVENTETSPVVSANALLFQGNNRDDVLFEQEGEETNIQYGDQFLVGKAKGEKRKYYDGEGEKVLEVKNYAGEDRFKVRTAEGAELWKVNWYPRKVKIKGEEKGVVYEIKRKDDKLTVDANEETVGEIKLQAESNLLQIGIDRSLYEINTDRRSMAFGVLLLEEITPQERYAIAAELLARDL